MDANITGTVSYTHLDVYKRQIIIGVAINLEGIIEGEVLLVIEELQAILIIEVEGDMLVTQTKLGAGKHQFIIKTVGGFTVNHHLHIR